MTNPLAAPPQPGTPGADYPFVFPDLPGRTATEDEFREYFGELESDDEPQADAPALSAALTVTRTAWLSDDLRLAIATRAFAFAPWPR